MATLATATSAAITKSLLSKLPSEAAKKFDIDETEFKEFLQGFLTIQLGKASKGGRSAGPKGKNGKGRISGYILFSNENREDVKSRNPEFKFTDVGKELGRMWGELTDEEKDEWNQKAAAQNKSNGLPVPVTKDKRKTVKKTVTKSQKSQKTATTDGGMKISRDKATKSWVVQGTTFVVQSPNNKVVTGKLRGNKVINLSPTDRKKCETNGWEMKTAPAKAAPKSRTKAAPKPVVEEDGDVEYSEEDHSDDEDSEDDE
uniref:High mobility group box n=1 Tax=Marseillevirus LCMAC201 TaxID=2506605 RepID=A0A481YWG4_9VIRU|nr:MAG: high mobility group box [Marseillevirus LCMAC201]